MPTSDPRWQWSRGRLTRRRTLALSGAAAFLAACGGSDKVETPGDGGNQGAAATTGSGAQPATAVAQTTETPVAGGTFTWSDTGDAPLDPTNNTTYRAQVLSSFTYSRLLKFKTGPAPETALNYELLPDLAASHEAIGDGTQITFKLQPNATFINKPPVSGHAVTSEDVKASVNRFRTSARNTNRGAFGTEANPLVTAVETPDSTTVVVKLARPYAAIFNLFANPQYMWILPKEADNGWDPAKEVIGSGPFLIEKIEPDTAITMRRNPNYFLQGRPYLDTVVRAVIPDTAQNIAQFQAGRLDAYGVPPQQSADVQKSRPTAEVLKLIPPSFNFLSPQQRSGPFRDVRLRRALSLALNRQALFDLAYVEGMKFNGGVPASMGKWWLDPQGPDAGAGGEFFKADPKAARDLLKAAGMENMPVRYTYTNNAYGDTFNQGAEAIAEMLREAGFRPTIVTQDYLREFITPGTGTFYGNYEGIFYNPQTSFTDPHDYLFSMAHPASARNHAGIDDPRLTQMLDDEERTLDEAARVKKVLDIQRFYIEQMVYVPTVLGNTYSFRQPWVKNYFYSATYGVGAESFVNAWIKK